MLNFAQDTELSNKFGITTEQQKGLRTFMCSHRGSKQLIKQQQNHNNVTLIIDKGLGCTKFI